MAVEEVVVTGSLKAEDVDGSAVVAVVEAAAEGMLSAGSWPSGTSAGEGAGWLDWLADSTSANDCVAAACAALSALWMWRSL